MVATVVIFAAEAKSYHQTYLNSFAGFPDAQIMQNRMMVDNQTASPSLKIDTTKVDSYKFRIFARIANLHNGESKSYKAKIDEQSSVKIANPTWGIVFNYTDNNNYCAVVLQCKTSSLGDVTEHREMLCQLIAMRNGMESIIESADINDNVNFYEGDNIVAIEHSEGVTSVKIGHKSPRTVIETRKISYGDSFTSGIYAGAASRVSVERFVTKSFCNPAQPLVTEWTTANLDSHFALSNDPAEGYWQYLDREMEEKKVKLGGRYTIAVVKNMDDGYDIIYISGAVVNSRNWHTGMLKGRLTKTTFIDEYDMVWYDSDMKYMPNDLSAGVENGSILSLRFPTLNSQIRFSKVRVNGE